MSVFKTYCEGDIFGFDQVQAEREREDEKGHHQDDLPIKSFSAQWLMDSLARKKLGGVRPSHAFLDKVQWGVRPGCLRVRLSPQQNVAVERLLVDRAGEPAWVAKRAYKIDVTDYAGNEDIVAEEVFAEVQKCYGTPLDSPAETYDTLFALVRRMTDRIRLVAPDTFMYRDIKEVNPDYYIIYFVLRGVGVGKLATRVRRATQTPEATIDVAFDRGRGLIHVIMSTISVGGEGAGWEIDIPYLDNFYAPSQTKDEIIDTVLTTLKYY